MRLCIIGLGKMGTGLLKGLLEAGIFSAKDIIGCDINVEKDEENPEYYNIKTVQDNRQGAAQADIIMLAVKPQIIPDVIPELKDVAAGKLIISIAAGITIGYMEEQFPTSRIVRVMPNTPALVGEGISALAYGKTISDNDNELVKSIFKGVGEIVIVKEYLIDAVTGLSGSGPAFVYVIIEALADGGVLNGLSRDLAYKLAAQTVLGAARMVQETGKHPGELKDMVASPAGTTINGLEVLEKNGLRGIIIDAVKRAAERSRELG